MQELSFYVQGSAHDLYLVRIFRTDEGVLRAHCSCPAGELRQHCKHRVGIFTGACGDVVDANADDLKTAVEWFSGTEMAAVVAEIAECEHQADELKHRASGLKKKLARLMQGE